MPRAQTGILGLALGTFFDYYVTYVVSAEVGMIQRWFERDLSESPETMARIMTVIASTQNPHYDRNEVAGMLGVPQNHVRCIQPTTGGGFGGKLDIGVQLHCALLAHYTKRPVKIVRSRVESTMISSKRHPITTHVKTGATKDGKPLSAVSRSTPSAPTIARTSVWTRYLLTPTTRCAARSADSACRRPPLSTRDRWTLWPRLCI